MNEHGTTQAILERFEALNKIPRKSKNEKRVAAWLADWAEDQGFPKGFDSAGNLIVHVPATGGREEEKTVILQGHMDMVCEKTPESDHDFFRDPIEHIVDGDWLKARDTTLGADNGIALAISMEVAISMSHPPLELLFTVDEETGLTGARNLNGAQLKGRLLINLDSEDEGVITIGCAGGRDAVLTLPLEPVAAEVGSSGDSFDHSIVADGRVFVSIQVGGLAGGHSGVDIHKQGGNANVLLARVIDRLLCEDSTRIAISGFSNLRGGSARNAIPRDAAVDLLVSENVIEQLVDEVESIEQIFQAELAVGDDEVSVDVVRRETIETSNHAILSIRYLERVVRVLLTLPTGVQRMSAEVEGLVESSCNLAMCGHEKNGIRITSSIRSSRDSRIDEISRRIDAVAKLSGASHQVENSYPAWPPAAESPFLERAKEIYESTFDRKPVEEIIHAGLECAVIGSAVPGIEMISIGPTIEGAHSPKERLYIPSIEKIWKYLEALLKK